VVAAANRPIKINIIGALSFFCLKQKTCQKVMTFVCLHTNNIKICSNESYTLQIDGKVNKHEKYIYKYKHSSN
jgi:hypothetical protein